MTTDSFGVPDNMFGRVPESFYGAVGRIVALGALVEMRFSGVIAELARLPEESLAGEQVGALRKRFQRLARDRASDGRPLPDRLTALCDEMSRAMERRNALVHSLWPEPKLDEARGWRTVSRRRRRPGEDYVVWTHTNDADLRSLIAELVRIAKELRDVVPMTGG